MVQVSLMTLEYFFITIEFLAKGKAVTQFAEIKGGVNWFDDAVHSGYGRLTGSLLADDIRITEHVSDEPCNQFSVKKTIVGNVQLLCEAKPFMPTAIKFPPCGSWRFDACEDFYACAVHVES